MLTELNSEHCKIRQSPTHLALELSKVEKNKYSIPNIVIREEQYHNFSNKKEL